MPAAPWTGCPAAGASTSPTRPSIATPVVRAAEQVAVRWVARDGSVTEATYAQLAARSNRVANVLVGLGLQRGDRVFTLAGTSAGAPRRGARCAQERWCRLSPVRHLRLRTRRTSPPPGRRPSTRDDGGDVRPGGGADPPHAPVLGARARGRRVRPSRDRRPRRPRRRRLRRFHDPRYRSRGHGAAPLHQRDHRAAEGGDARPRGRRRPSRHGPGRPRPSGRRHLVVHRRPGLGDRDVVRDHRAARRRRDHAGRRGRLRRSSVVWPAGGSRRRGLVHGADRAAHADAGRRRPGRRVRPVPAPSGGQRRRDARRRHRRVDPSRRSGRPSTTPGGRPRPARS